MMEGSEYTKSVFGDLEKLSKDQKITMLYQLLGWFADESEFQRVFSEFLMKLLKDKE